MNKLLTILSILLIATASYAQISVTESTRKLCNDTGGVYYDLNDCPPCPKGAVCESCFVGCQCSKGKVWVDNVGCSNKELYEEAREQKRGLWKDKPPNRYLEDSLFCEKDEDCSIRGGACGPEPMNIHFDNSKLIEMRPYVECADYFLLENPRCEKNKCIADVVGGDLGGKEEMSSKPVTCTMEAKICPDGSAVGRVGPNCEFSPCPE